MLNKLPTIWNINLHWYQYRNLQKIHDSILKLICHFGIWVNSDPWPFTSSLTTGEFWNMGTELWADYRMSVSSLSGVNCPWCYIFLHLVGCQRCQEPNSFDNPCILTVKPKTTTWSLMTPCKPHFLSFSIPSNATMHLIWTSFNYHLVWISICSGWVVCMYV